MTELLKGADPDPNPASSISPLFHYVRGGVMSVSTRCVIQDRWALLPTVDTRRVRRSRRRREREAVASQRSDRSWKAPSGMVSKQQEPTAAQHSTAQEEFQFPKRSPTITQLAYALYCVWRLHGYRLRRALHVRPRIVLPCLVSNCRTFLTAGGKELKTQAISITRQCNAMQLNLALGFHRVKQQRPNFPRQANTPSKTVS